ncbi:MFS transporter [Amylibacter sp. SFDW26]|uniref:MFS transporter n=1 Tax=Amylibacter sp. SFDW26 TaxID=2652722 RepID=UPI0012615610|nr:MFS transporter [Amylibacter sp. SFDW26]KAB7614683.1 MFS transporter [Amylibacter sp. SFDW26]
MSSKVSKKAIWSWMSYDWAAQPYHTLLVTFIFAPYFTSAVVGDGTQGQIMWGTMMTIIGVILAVSAPIMGAIADTTGPRKPWIMACSILFVLGAFPLWLATPGMDDPTRILMFFAIGFIGVEMSQIFVSAMLPDLGDRSEIGKISGSGWGFGYLGGVLTLFIMLLLLAENDKGVTLLGNAPLFGLDAEAREGTRSVGPLTGLWYIVFMIPFFLWVPDTKRKPKVANAISNAMKELFNTIKKLPQDISLFAYLGSSMFYRDALNGLYAFGGIYAAGVLGWSIVQIGIFGIIAAITAAVASWIGGFMDRAYGPKKVIIFCIVVLIVVCILLVGTSRESFFAAPLAEGSTLPDKMMMICGALIGGAGGAIQASSRTMMVFQANKERMTEAFGLYALSGRATAFLAPGLIALFTDLTQSQRLGILPVAVLLLIGLVLLVWVRPGKEYE